MKELDECLDTLAHRLPVLSKYGPTQLKCRIRNTLILCTTQRVNFVQKVRARAC